jgi:hypothetical protein
LQRQRLGRSRRHPQIDLLGRGQDHRHSLWVERAHVCVRLRGCNAAPNSANLV